jgi:multidrug transporter EmrE-like cation transporter
MKVIFILLLLGGVLLEVVADIFLKKWSIENKALLLALGLALYIASTVAWAYSLKYGFLSKGVAIFTILNLILVVLAGVFMFNEQLTLVNKIGIGLGIASIIFLEI